MALAYNTLNIKQEPSLDIIDHLDELVESDQNIPCEVIITKNEIMEVIITYLKYLDSFDNNIWILEWFGYGIPEQHIGQTKWAEKKTIGKYTILCPNNHSFLIVYLLFECL